jgi:MFS transporter, MHS family, proline/betaine transporter
MKRSIVLVVLAVNFLEWLEFGLYLYMAKTVFAHVFFPESDNSLMLTFALFAAAYLARPIGGWIFGRAADLNGRRKPMMFTAGLMGAATLGICILPGYEQIGVLATWLLLLLRILQGLALGGEVNTSAMFMIEHHAKSPLYTGSLVAAFGALGMFVGGVLAALIQYSDFNQLWRIIFACVGLVSLFVCKLRKQLSESPEFNTRQTITVTELWQTHWRGMANIAATGVFVSTTVYLCNIFWLAFATQQHIWTSRQCAWVAAFAQLGSALFAIPIARLSKKENALKLLNWSMAVIAVSAPCLFYFTYHQVVTGTLLGLLGYMLASGLLCASFYYFLYLQLPAQFRCRGVSIIWALSASTGALALPLAQQAISVKELYWVPGAMVSIAALFSFITIKLTTFKQHSTINDVRTA